MTRFAIIVFWASIQLIWFAIPELYVADAWGGIISPFELTFNRMDSTMDRIQDYTVENHRLPQKLSDLPNDPIRDNKLTDGWGEPLAYIPQPDGSIILRGSGVDGRKNGRFLRFSILDKVNDTEVRAKWNTINSMENIELKIYHFMEAYRRLPEKLTDLDILDDHIMNGPNNGWDQPISYDPRPDGFVVLNSKGRPGSKEMFSLGFNVPQSKLYKPTTAPTTKQDDGENGK